MRTAVLGIALVTALSMLSTSCASVGPIVTATGEKATIRFHDGREQVVELIAVEDSTILTLALEEPFRGGSSGTGSAVTEVPAGSIALIEVSGFRNNGWWGGVVAFQVLPSIGLAGAAAAAEAEWGAVLAVSLIPAALTALLYAESGVPTPTFEDPISEEDLRELSKYARFAGKLSAVQKEELYRMRDRE